MKVDRRDLCEMPHKVLIDVLLCSHTVHAQIRAQQAASNDLAQNKTCKHTHTQLNTRLTECTISPQSTYDTHLMKCTQQI